MLQRGKFNIIIGGQAGSESKGKLSAYICGEQPPDLLFMTSSPNAGHTAYTKAGVKKVSYHLPIGSIMCDCPIVLGPASIINPITFNKEVKELGIDPGRIYIDGRAAVITNELLQKEASNGLSDIGSTLQGVGSCRSNKMMRGQDVTRVRDLPSGYLSGNFPVDTNHMLHYYLKIGSTVLCESTQGFDLDLEHGIHPRYCTSKMVNTSMIAAEAGVPPQMIGEVYGVIRPYPIRVNNRTGTSGPYAEAKEITWGDVARWCGYPGDPDEFGEITTTTKLPRRVFEFSRERYLKFVTVCQPTAICLQFANYIDWRVFCSDALTSKVEEFIRLINSYGHPVRFVGTGPSHEHMVTLKGDVIFNR